MPIDTSAPMASNASKTTKFFKEFWLYAVGRACCLSWLVVVASHLLATYSYFFTFFFFLGAIVPNIVLWRFSSKIYSYRWIRVITAVAAVVCVASFSLCHFSNDLPDICIVILFFLNGVGTGLLYALGGVIPSALSLDEAYLWPIAESIFQALIIVGAFLLFRSEITLYLVCALPIASTILILPRKVKIEGLFSESVSLVTRKSDVKSLVQSCSALLSIWFLYGLSIGFIYANKSYIWLFVIGIVLAASVKLYDTTHKRRFEVGVLIKILAPVTCAILLLVKDFSYGPAVVVLIVITVFVAESGRIISHTAASNYMHVYRLNPISNMSIVCPVLLLGTMCGYFAMVTTGSLAEVGKLPYSDIIIDVLVLCAVLLQAFLYRDNYSPFIEHSSLVEVTDSPIEIEKRDFSPWKNKCKRFSEHYGLTPRQTETLLLVAKGYSTSAITSMLCISSHTEKAHLYAIYQKTDTHSRQELIEKIEAFETQECDIESK